MQEKEGPKVAKKLLYRLGFDNEASERIQYLVGHHHTYTNIDSIDYHILVEADFLVNLYEDNLPIEAVKKAYDTIFETSAGKNICKAMFGLQ